MNYKALGLTILFLVSSGTHADAQITSLSIVTSSDDANNIKPITPAEAEENSDPTTHAELLYDCAGAFTFTKVSGGNNLGLMHNQIFIPTYGRLFVINRTATSEFFGRHNMVTPLKVTPEGETQAIGFNYDFTIENGRGTFLAPNEITGVTQSTFRKKLSTSDAESVLQGLMLTQATREGQFNIDLEKQAIKRNVDQVLKNNNYKYRPSVQVFTNFMSQLTPREKKLESCKKLGNGTISHAAEMEAKNLSLRRQWTKEAFAEEIATISTNPATLTSTETAAETPTTDHLN